MTSSDLGTAASAKSKLRGERVPSAAEFAALTAMFSTGGVGVRSYLSGPSFATAKQGWWPTVAGRHVVLKDTPECGYPTRAEAYAAAVEYRSQCRQFRAREASPAATASPATGSDRGRDEPIPTDRTSTRESEK